jgi:hypothetical protein
MMDAAAPLRGLVEAIYKKSSSGELDWIYEQDENVCETRIGDGYFQVCADTDDDGDYYYYVKILNQSKQVIDTIYGGNFQDYVPTTGHQNYWQLITDLRTLAFRKALGADEVIKSMLSALHADADAGSPRGKPGDDVPF